MTDVEITLEGCDHAMTQPGARVIAREIISLVHKAEAIDAPPPPKIIVRNGMVDATTVQAVMAHEYDRPNLVKWHTASLWRHLTSSFWLYELHCLACRRLHEECACKHKYSREYLAIPLSQIFGHHEEFARSKPSPSVGHDYNVLTRRLRELTNP